MPTPQVDIYKLPLKEFVRYVFQKVDAEHDAEFYANGRKAGKCLQPSFLWKDGA
jgi:hypothetical protein